MGRTKELLIEDWEREWAKDFVYLLEEQHDHFRNYSIKLIKKVFKCNTNRAKSTFDWFDLGYGLKVV